MTLYEKVCEQRKSIYSGVEMYSSEFIKKMREQAEKERCILIEHGVSGNLLHDPGRRLSALMKLKV